MAAVFGGLFVQGGGEGKNRGVPLLGPWLAFGLSQVIVLVYRLPRALGLFLSLAISGHAPLKSVYLLWPLREQET